MMQIGAVIPILPYIISHLVEDFNIISADATEINFHI